MNDIAFPLYFNWVDIMRRRLTKNEMSTAIAALTEYFRTGEVDYGALPPKLAYGMEFMVAQIEFAREKKEKASEYGKRASQRTTETTTDPGYPEGTPGGGSGYPEGTPEGTRGDPPANKKKKKNTKTNTNGSSVKKKYAPNMIEVNGFFGSERLNADPEEFFNYYESVGWVDGKGNPIVDWRARAIAWASHKASKTGDAVRTFFDSEDRDNYYDYEKEKMKGEWEKYYEKLEKEGPGYDAVCEDRAYFARLKRERDAREKGDEKAVPV